MNGFNCMNLKKKDQAGGHFQHLMKYKMTAVQTTYYEVQILRSPDFWVIPREIHVDISSLPPPLLFKSG